MAKQRTTTEPAGATSKRIDALRGVNGHVRFQAGTGARAYTVQDGALQPEDPSTATDSVIIFDDEKLVDEVFAGTKNPVVMALQGRLRVEGNLELATRVLFGLIEGSAGGKSVVAEVRS